MSYPTKLRNCVRATFGKMLPQARRAHPLAQIRIYPPTLRNVLHKFPSGHHSPTSAKNSLPASKVVHPTYHFHKIFLQQHVSRRAFRDLYHCMSLARKEDFRIDRCFENAPGNYSRFTRTRLNRSYYLQIEETPDYTIAIFALPKGSSMILHNHPNMTVVTKLLAGECQIKTYDLLTQKPQSPTPAFYSGTHTATPDSAPLVLYPHLHNVHVITSQTGCAFLDVLAPPYLTDVRDCSYFEVCKDHHVPNETLQGMIKDEYELVDEERLTQLLGMSDDDEEEGGGNAASERSVSDYLLQKPANFGDDLFSQIAWLRRIQPPNDFFCAAPTLEDLKYI